MKSFGGTRRLAGGGSTAALIQQLTNAGSIGGASGITKEDLLKYLASLNTAPGGGGSEQILQYLRSLLANAASGGASAMPRAASPGGGMPPASMPAPVATPQRAAGLPPMGLDSMVPSSISPQLQQTAPPPAASPDPYGVLMEAAKQAAVNGMPKQAPTNPDPTGALAANGKYKKGWRDYLKEYGLPAIMGAGIGQGIGGGGGGMLTSGLVGAAIPLLIDALKKKKSDTEKKATGGMVQAKSGRKFGGKAKQPAAPSKSAKSEAPSPAMKSGGCVKKMATGGLVSRGMGAAKRGGDFRSC